MTYLKGNNQLILFLNYQCHVLANVKEGQILKLMSFLIATYLINHYISNSSYINESPFHIPFDCVAFQLHSQIFHDDQTFLNDLRTEEHLAEQGNPSEISQL